MRPLTDVTPKPLLQVHGKPLIVWHLEKLAALGVNDVVINTSHLAEQFPETLGDGARWGLRIRYAYEGNVPLETGGGMLNALPLLGPEPFIAISGDIWCDADLRVLPTAPGGLIHLLMVDNPPHHPHGDFALADDGRLNNDGEERLTYSGIGVFRPELLLGWQSTVDQIAGGDEKPPRFKLAPLLRNAIGQGRANGTHFRGRWTDVGTPERLASLGESLAD
jgi:MurNAc alpha-1-phosphate uridylyltransferase